MKALSFFSVLGLVFVSGNAFADRCDQNEDCPVAFECTQISIPCDDPTEPWMGCECKGEEDACWCPDTMTVVDVSGSFHPDDTCEPRTEGVCTFAPPTCTDNLDCPAGFECREQEYCTGGACSCHGGGGGESCVCPDCNEDAGDPCPPCDCEIFEWAEDDACSCEEEQCETLGAVCVPAEVVCLQDEDCLDGFECAVFGDDEGEDRPCGSSCTCQSVADGEADVMNCWCEEICEGNEEVSQQTPAEGLCLPEGWKDEFQVNDDGTYYEENDDQTGAGDPKSGDVLAGADLGLAGGDTAASGEETSSTKKSSSTSCSVGTGSSPGAGLLALLFLGLALLRRRQPQV
jgi:MYXO-CTERM domain-containing protein